jgi:hypothetical protein
LVDGTGVAPEVAAARQRGLNAIVLPVSDEKTAAADRIAADTIRAAGLDLYYWIEIGRHVETADAHPLWMASLQGHQEWRRLFPQTPRPAANEVIKAYPWVPVLYREAFDEHLRRVNRLVAALPPAKGVFLNDLQAAPSACGCGNILCRWTNDYGPIRTATELGPDAAAKFVAEVARLAPDSAVIPVWVTECEEHDRDGPCAGVGCFRGLCWKEYVKQLASLEKQAPQIGVLLPLRDFQRELPAYREPAGWITQALASFHNMPPQHGAAAVAAQRLIAVVQGWDVSEQQIQQQTDRALAAGVAGVVVSRTKIDQRWEPRVVRFR